jgi:hypothetical protein
LVSRKRREHLFLQASPVKVPADFCIAPRSSSFAVIEAKVEVIEFDDGQIGCRLLKLPCKGALARRAAPIDPDEECLLPAL